LHGFVISGKGTVRGTWRAVQGSKFKGVSETEKSHLCYKKQNQSYDYGIDNYFDYSDCPFIHFVSAKMIICR